MSENQSEQEAIAEETRPQPSERLNDLAHRLMLARAEEAFPRGRAIFLIGAGCSASAGVPTASGVVDIALAWLVGKYGINPSGQGEIDYKHLKNNGLNILNSYGPELYTELFDVHITDPDHEREIIQKAIDKGDNINWAHIGLGHLVNSKIVHTVITTNFDLLVLRGMIYSGVIPVVADGLNDLSRIGSRPRVPQLIHLHGSLHTYRMRNSREAVRATSDDKGAQTTMAGLLRDSTVFVVVGYGGREEGVMDLLQASLVQWEGKRIFWIAHGDALSERTKKLQKALGDRFTPIFNQDADQFFDRLLQATRIGSPQWLTHPIQALRDRAGSIVRPGNSTNGRAIYDQHREIIRTLEQCLSGPPSGDDGDAAGPPPPQPSLDDAGTKPSEADALSSDATLSDLLLRGDYSGAVAMAQRSPPSTASVLWRRIASTAADAATSFAGASALAAAIQAAEWLLANARRPDPSVAEVVEAVARAALDGGRDHAAKAVSLLQRVIEAHRTLASEPEAETDAVAALANSKFLLASALRSIGVLEDALAPIEEATTLYRALTEAKPDAFRPDLAKSLNNLAICLADLGQREAALATIEEAAGLYRTLAQQRPDAFTPDLAASLQNLSVRLGALGQREDALEAIKEATGLFRTLAQQRPDAFTPDLGMSLNNLSVRLADLGRREDALAAIEEAVALRRTLAQQRPDAFTPDLAQSLNNLSNRLADFGRRQEALAAIEEAVTLRHALAQARPDAFTPDLAQSLNNLSVSLGAQDRHEEALAAVEKATGLFRTLAQQRPDAFTPDLAKSLNNLSVRLADLGRHEEALAAIEEAVALRRTLAQVRPDAFVPDLATSLGARGAILRHSDAAAAVASFGEGIATLEAMFHRYPAAFAGLMGALVLEYRTACEAAGIAPDEALLAPIEAVLATLPPAP